MSLEDAFNDDELYNQIVRDDCYICGRGHPDVLERHHIVPRRHGGSDEPDNLVDVCPTCHTALETLYDKRFYRDLGVNGQGREVDNRASDVELRAIKETIRSPENKGSVFGARDYADKEDVINDLVYDQEVFAYEKTAKKVLERTLNDEEIWVHEPKRGYLEVLE